MNNESIQDEQDERIRTLEATVERLEAENRILQAQTRRPHHWVQEQQHVQSCIPTTVLPDKDSENNASRMTVTNGTLSNDEVERYSRQLMVGDGVASPWHGVQGQLKLRHAKVVVVGAGGIGSTALLYLAGAGVGQLTIVDLDSVEMSNLHRQIIHSVDTVGISKAQSARQAVLRLNPTIHCVAVEVTVTVHNVAEFIQKETCDCVVDASDNPATRYLLNDACYFANVPLVSGSAVGTEGQCSVYHYRNNDSNSNNNNQHQDCCYRCMYPSTSQRSCQSCSDAGVLGPVPGLIGILQAMEVLKILTAPAADPNSNLNNSNISSTDILHNHLLMYDAVNASFLRLKKPPRQASCALCGDHPTITSLDGTRRDLERVRGPAAMPRSQPHSFDVTCREYYQQYHHLPQPPQPPQPHLLLDVRVPAQFALCRLPRAVNLPLRDLPDQLDQIRVWTQHDPNYPVYCVCRRGNDSIRAVQLLQQHGWTNVHNLREGLVAWRRDVDPAWPSY